MASKHKHRAAPVLTPELLRSRIRRAVQEDRYQHGLELAKQLHKQDPSPQSGRLLGDVYLGRSRQLRKQGYLRDAVQLLDRALELAGTQSARLGPIAMELAACGEVRRALALTNGTSQSGSASGIVCIAADTALQKGPAGRELLPESLQQPFDLIRRAAQQIEGGQDERARETLQGIGLQSPFLEWKVFLRGLSAYCNHDDVRALENWQRLDPERLPAILAAPLRYPIDPGFREAQTPTARAVLQKQRDRGQGSGVLPLLRALQPVIADLEQLPSAFRMAETLYPALRQQAPHLAPRLAGCFYWAAASGAPEAVNRYQRVFSAPPDDPHLYRLRALQAEHFGEMQKAHDYWQKFEKSVAENLTAWPGDQARRTRALVWWHMGQNAAHVPDPDAIPDLPDFLRNHPACPRPLSPPAERCFARSIELAPDFLAAHEARLDYFEERDDDAQAEQAARQLLERFPEHVHALKTLGDLRIKHKDPAEGLSLLLRALKASPLEHKLRDRVSYAYAALARSHAEAGRFDQARQQYVLALTYDEPGNKYATLCKWAACEFKAKDAARAEELLQQACDSAGNQLAPAYSMLIETIRLKLPKALKTRFTEAFEQALAEPVTPSAAVSIVGTACGYRLSGVSYPGQKTHEKKVLAYLEKAVSVDFSEQDLERICRSLLGLETLTLLRKFTTRGRKRFPANAHFPLLEAESYFTKGPSHCPPRKVEPLLAKASRLAQAMPATEERQGILEEIDMRRQMLQAAGLLGGMPPMEMLEGIFGKMMEDDDDLDFDDDY